MQPRDNPKSYYAATEIEHDQEIDDGLSRLPPASVLTQS